MMLTQKPHIIQYNLLTKKNLVENTRIMAFEKSEKFSRNQAALQGLLLQITLIHLKRFPRYFLKSLRNMQVTWAVYPKKISIKCDFSIVLIFEIQLKIQMIIFVFSVYLPMLVRMQLQSLPQRRHFFFRQFKFLNTVFKIT